MAFAQTKPNERALAIRDDVAFLQAVRAELGVMVKRILRQYGYPPDKQEKAARTVLERAEVSAADWAV